MQLIINVGILILLWVVNLFNGTGLDQVYHVTELAQRFTILLFILHIGYKFLTRHDMLVKKKSFYTFGGMAVIFFFSPLLNGYGRMAGIDYLWVFCLIYLLAHMKIDEKTMLWTGLAYGVMGFAILYIFDFGSALKGWNENSIAMIGMHSYLLMLVPLFRTHRIRSKLILVGSAFLFSYMVSPTNSRSGIWFGFLAVLLAIGVIPRKIVTGNRRITLLWLLAPLLVAIVVVMFSKGGYMSALNQWSYRQFNKPIFNGRDELWESGFKGLWTSPLFGKGNLNVANWHNSAVTCLYAMGIAGFAFWVASFANILNRAREYMSDYIITGCFVGFIVLYAQQSVELGFISGNPTLLGYVLLGIMLGRVNFLREGEYA